MPRIAFVVVVAVAVLLLSFTVVDAAAKKKKKPAPPKPEAPPPESGVPRGLTKDDAAKVPDPNNAKDKFRLECSACITAASEVGKRLEKVHKEFKYEPEKVKEYHIMAAVDELCEREVFHYGMFRDGIEKIVYPKFVDENDERWKSTTVKGGWATKLWQRVCHEMMERIEDDIPKAYRGEKIQFCPTNCKKALEEEDAEMKAVAERHKKYRDEMLANEKASKGKKAADDAEPAKDATSGSGGSEGSAEQPKEDL